MYKAYLKSNDRSEYDQTFEGDIYVSDDAIIKDNLNADEITCNKVKATEVEGTDKVESGGILACRTLEKSGLATGDNYINIFGTPRGSVPINQFLRFRSGNTPLGLAGTVFSSYDNRHTLTYQYGDFYFMTGSSQNSGNPESISFTNTILIANNTNGNISFGGLPTSPVKMEIVERNKNVTSFLIKCLPVNEVPVNLFTISNENTNGVLTISDSSNSPTVRLKTNGHSYLRGGNVTIGDATEITTAQLAINSNSKGFLPPRLTTIERNNITLPAKGLIVFDITVNNLYVYNGVSWIELVESFSRNFIKLTRNTDLTTQGDIPWESHYKNGPDFNFTNGNITFAVNTTGYYEIAANLVFLTTDAESQVNLKFEQTFPSTVLISQSYGSVSYIDTSNTYGQVNLNDIVLLPTNATFRFNYTSLQNATVKLSGVSRVTIKRIT